MSRKNYIAAAAILRDVPMSDETRTALVARFVTLFADDNPRFSPSRFHAACAPVVRCTTCGRPADDGYVNVAAGERCVDPVHFSRRAA